MSPTTQPFDPYIDYARNIIQDADKDKQKIGQKLDPEVEVSINSVRKSGGIDREAFKKKEDEERKKAKEKEDKKKAEKERLEKERLEKEKAKGTA